MDMQPLQTLETGHLGSFREENMDERDVEASRAGSSDRNQGLEIRETPPHSILTA